MTISTLKNINYIRWMLVRCCSTHNTSTTVFDVGKKFNRKFDFSTLPNILKQIESRWKGVVDQKWQSVINSEVQGSDKTKYILSMFPYPSGQLHLGHIRIYTTSDIYFKTSFLCGENSIHPMGFDSFGLPAENAAIQHNQNPFLWTQSNMDQMKSQFNKMGYHFHWRECTSDPTFYRWTQWLFIQLYRSNLVYQGISQVNWDPVDCTVLADEQVDGDGRSWRSGALVEKRFHKQWLVKTNAFADDLYTGEDVLDTGHWSSILATQRWWVQKPNGYLFYLKLDNQPKGVDTLQVFTPRPELFRSPNTFVAVSPTHWLAQGKPNGCVVATLCNPFVNHSHQMDIRVVADSSVQMPKSTQATLCLLGENFENEQIRQEVISVSKQTGLGAYLTSDTYRDWLISRQRYWGTPIPIVHCPTCGPVPEKEDNLPIVLPEIAYQNISDFKSNEISSPLQQFSPKEWLKVKCPSCGSDHASRETDTCDTFFDSSWYFLRYFSKPTPEKAFDGQNLVPVYCYVGGKEHAALHLFYARFITHFLHSKGHIHFREPFRTLLMQSVIKGKTYKLNGKYLTAEQAENMTGVEITYEKMSKSKGNGVNPDDLVAEYGSDAVRWTIMTLGNRKSEQLWDNPEKEFKETMTFFYQILLTIEEFIAAKRNQNKGLKVLEQKTYESSLVKLAQSTDQSIFSILCSLNATYEMRIATLEIQKMIRSLRGYIRNNVVFSPEFDRGLASFLVMISPFMPCLAAECWHSLTEVLSKNTTLSQCGFDIDKPVYEQVWPRVTNPQFKYTIRFTHRNQEGKEQNCGGVKVPLKDLGLWESDEIRHLLQPLEQEIEWIHIVKHCSVSIRVRNEQMVRQVMSKSRFQWVEPMIHDEYSKLSASEC